MTTEDFSFPAVHKSSSTRSIDFPPLWRPSPCHEDEEDHSTPVEEDCNQRKSFACVEGVDDDQIIVGILDQDEKMDMLWEDFNEELYPARSTTSEYVSGNMLQLGCVGLGAFNLSKSNAATSGSAITNPGMVLIVRVLKRLFFLHNSHHHNLNKPAKR
ncbi:PREDICTED: uncharacterized protein LOC101303684 [Fragaria vesca subsp. vesca]|uniref:uncharacterized protein LOC101303684 n=1 Tax=Fragaria vesca subsp. vesca TaxID=101020 RepID=UPI0002C35C66|nr:PREDICTED: uncharacterized protein LOC101303684 [Fragaria vesca subsp. vesca]